MTPTSSLVVRAQPAPGGVEVRASDARSSFPDGIIFTLSASASGGFQEVRLVYEIAPDGVPTTALPDCTEGDAVRCTYELESSRRGAFLIPGAQVSYSWRLTTADGATQETPEQVVTYEDTRFSWQTLSEGNLTVWWYAGDEAEARRVLAAGRESLDGIGRLLQTTVGFPVKVFYYANPIDMQPAIIPSLGEGVITAGEVVYSDTAMVSRSGAAEEIARHEIAHIVVRQAVKPPHDIPAWLNEGTATFAQSAPFAEQQQALELAIRSNNVLSVRSLSSQSAGATVGNVSLFYGQSWSLVSFLIETYGEEKFAQLFQAFNEGATTQEALEQVYGFNQDGLENAWRDSVGLPPRTVPTPQEERVEPTPAASPQPQAEKEDEGDGGGAPIAVLVTIAALTVLLAGGLLVRGVALARRWR